MTTLLTVRQAAGCLGVSLPTMRRLIATGEIPVVTLRRNSKRSLLRVRTETLERVIRQREERQARRKAPVRAPQRRRYA